jgi:hypothetical protein
MDTLLHVHDRHLRETLEELEFQIAFLVEFQKVHPENERLELRLRQLVWRASKCLGKLSELRRTK